MSNDLKQNFTRRINSAISQIESLPDDGSADEIKSNLSKYLCILISGYTEKVFINMLVQYFTIRNSPRIPRFITQTHKHTTNLKMKKIEEILSSFDSYWSDRLHSHMKYDEYSAAVNSISENRNKIAHGDNTNVTVNNLKIWFSKIEELFDEISRIIATS